MHFTGFDLVTLMNAAFISHLWSHLRPRLESKEVLIFTELGKDEAKFYLYILFVGSGHFKHTDQSRKKAKWSIWKDKQVEEVYPWLAYIF